MSTRARLAAGVILVGLAGLAACGGDGGGSDSVVEHTTPPSHRVREPSDVRVFVINGAGVPMAAATKADALRAVGYTIAGIGNAPLHQPGTVVACRTGFVSESAQLAAAVGPATTIVGFPDPAPEGVEQADCMVGLGT